jgi:hypothetical protein
MARAGTVEHVSADDAIEEYYRRGWTDGLPVVPPTRARVQAFLDYAGRDPEEVVAAMAPTRRACTVEQ